MCDKCKSLCKQRGVVGPIRNIWDITIINFRGLTFYTLYLWMVGVILQIVWYVLL